MRSDEAMTLRSRCPAVSICIPSCGEPAFLEAAVKSCLVQTFRDFEIVISDDTPGDSVAAVALALAAQDCRIRYHRNPGPHGAAANSNHAARLARGEWLKFLHHDDALVDEGALQHFIDSSADVDFIFSPCHWTEGASSGVYRIDNAGYAALRRCPVRALVDIGNLVGAPSAVMVRREFFAPFDESMVWLFDLFSYLQSALKGARFLCLDRPVVLINKHFGQLTRKVSGDAGIALREGLAICRHLDAVGERRLAARHALRLVSRAPARPTPAAFGAAAGAAGYRPWWLFCAWSWCRALGGAKALCHRRRRGLRDRSEA